MSRKQAEEFLYGFLEELFEGDKFNADIYRKKIGAMSDKEFEAYKERLRSGEEFFAVIAPNNSQQKLSVRRNLEIAKKIGHEFFQKIWLYNEEDDQHYLTPTECMIISVPGRRASQTVVKKASIPKNSKVVDAMSGQPTGASKGAKISHPEHQILLATGCFKAAEELLKYRGGDQKGRAALNALLSKNGEASLDVVKQFSSGVVSNYTLSALLTSAHLRNNLVVK